MYLKDRCLACDGPVAIQVDDEFIVDWPHCVRCGATPEGWTPKDQSKVGDEDLCWPHVGAYWDDRSEKALVVQVFAIWEEAGAAEFLGMLPRETAELYRLPFDLPPQEWIDGHGLYSIRAIPAPHRTPTQVIRLMEAYL